jgi:hypothetical protein
MTSEKQIAANRRNALQSTGPKTPAGKAQSSRNSLRHALTGQVALLPAEDRAAHDTFCEELIASLNPETAIEQQLAHSIAEDSWRLNRVCALETNIFALGHAGERRELQLALADAKTFLSHANSFALLTIYEQRINRSLQRNLAQLRALQQERKAQRQHDLEQATVLAQVNLMNGLPYHPERDGFVFSNSEINYAIDRNNRLEAARAQLRRPANPQIPAAAPFRQAA